MTTATSMSRAVMRIVPPGGFNAEESWVIAPVTNANPSAARAIISLCFIVSSSL